jgi:hypothetical protein
MSDLHPLLESRRIGQRMGTMLRASVGTRVGAGFT